MVPFKRNALKVRDEAIYHLLDKLGRCRPLDDWESDLLLRTSNRLAVKRERWHWTPDDDHAVLVFMVHRQRKGLPRPYQRNNEVRRLATRLGRSYMAVHRRMERLRARNEELFKRADAKSGLIWPAWTPPT